MMYKTVVPRELSSVTDKAYRDSTRSVSLSFVTISMSITIFAPKKTHTCCDYLCNGVWGVSASVGCLYSLLR